MSLTTGNAEHARQEAIENATAALRRVVAEVQRRFAMHFEGQLSMADLHTLHFIARNVPTTPGEIAAFTGLTSGSITGLLDRLEAHQLIERRRSSNDRRVVQVRLHACAHARIGARMHDLHAGVATLFDDLDEVTITNLAALLDRLRTTA